MPVAAIIPGMSFRARRAPALLALLVGLSLLPAPQAVRAADTAIGSPASPMSTHLSRDVYGYLPYWKLDRATIDAIDWNALSILGLFSVTQRADGTLDTGLAGYRAITGSLGREVIATARARGVRTELTLTSFGLDKNDTFFANATAQARTIEQLVALARDLGVDGVSVDVELIHAEFYDAWAAFSATLRGALRAVIPDATVSVATNGNWSGSQMAKRAAASGIDRIFLMGYSYRSAGSAPGAIAPLDTRSSTGLDIVGTLDRYAADGVPLGKVLLGLPWYGMSWPTESGVLGARATGGGSTYVPASWQEMPAALGVPLNYESRESVSWYAFRNADGTWRQVFFDTPQSLRPKYQLAIARGLAGVGIWVIGYQGTLPGYWEQLREMFGPPRVTSAVAAPALSNGSGLTVTATALAGSRPVTELRVRPDGAADWGAWTVLPEGTVDGTPVSVSTAIPAGVADGTRRILVQVRDDGGTLSAPVAASVVLDRTGPSGSVAPTLFYHSTLQRWRVRWTAASDPHGPVRYKVRISVNGGAWTVLTMGTTNLSWTLPVASRTAHFAVRVTPYDALRNPGTTRSVSR